MRSQSLEDVVTDLVSKHGLVTLANSLDIDKGDLSRFKNGERGLCVAKVDQLLSKGGMIVIPREEYRNLVRTIFTLSDIARRGVDLTD